MFVLVFRVSEEQKVVVEPIKACQLCFVEVSEVVCMVWVCMFLKWNA